MNTTTQTPTPLDELLHSLFVTAIEGGVNYWASVSGYRWSINGNGNDEDYKGFSAMIHDDENNDPPEAGMLVDRKVMARGYRLATTTHRSKIYWSSDTPPLIVTKDALNDYDYDAGDADCILQLGLFGEVVYG